MLGGRESGKTNIINAYLENKFSFETLPTTECDTFYKKFNFDNWEYLFKIFDTAGQERYRKISNSTIQIADGIVMVFAIDNHNSYKEIVYWIKFIDELINLEEKVLFIIGNKIDVKPEERKVTKNQVEEFTKRINVKYFETSAYSRQGINVAFKEIFKEVYEKNKLDNNNKPNYQYKKKINYSSICTNEIKKLNNIIYNTLSKLFPLNK